MFFDVIFIFLGGLTVGFFAVAFVLIATYVITNQRNPVPRMANHDLRFEKVEISYLHKMFDWEEVANEEARFS